MKLTEPEMIFEELLVQIQGGKVLDIGCGSGQFIAILMQSLGSFDSITGVDVDDEALEEARSKFRSEKFNFIKASSLNLPFEDASFDFVCISKALHHVENDRQTLEEMKRVLKQGGYLLINEMIRDGLFAREKTIESVREALDAGRTAVWRGDELYGQAEDLKTIFEQSIRVLSQPVRLKGKGFTYVQVINDSDLIFKLKMGEGLPGFGYAPEIVLYPGRIAIMPLQNLTDGKVGEADIHIPFTVTNLITGPEETLSVTLDMQVNFAPED